MSSLKLADIAAAMAAAQSQSSNVTLFVSIMKRLWNTVVEDANLPDNIVSFLVQVLPTPATVDEIQSLWQELRIHIPTWQGPLLQNEVDNCLRQFGHGHSLVGAEMLYPPYRTCIQPECSQMNIKLKKPYSAQCRVYTLRRGILPAYETSLACHRCNTRYHYAYFVVRASEADSQREFYAEYQPYVHAQESSFVEDRLCEYFGSLMCLSHTSSSDLARSYNLDLGRMDTTNRQTLLSELAQSTVMEAFFLHAILRRSRRYNQTLRVPHRGDWEHRLDNALDFYNQLMAGTGQPQYCHACHDCLKFFRHPDTQRLLYMRGGTTDGVTNGHPRCLVDKCQMRLESMKDHFCPAHLHLQSVCLIRGCDLQAEKGRLTCSQKTHRDKEEEYSKQSESAFSDLTRRLNKDNVPRTSRRKPSSLSTQKASNHSTFIAASGTESGTSKLKLQLTRNWTHNEQLFVLSCGVIISRSTFFYSEGVASVKEFLKRVFPWPWVLPTHIFYDNACHLLQHLNATDDSYFKSVRLAVDVFHARHHHKEDGDTFCNTNNNPALFPELRITEGKWSLNSSIAEQTNVWFGAFQAMTREMSVPRYNFFLDEMILIRNEWFVGEQERKGKQPFMLDFEALKAEWNHEHP
ncbi:hypothetical protein R3P38DRAFT_2527960 [Favolaschia claudopus]|uniref:CxC5 like cysteine cluster associated with KDZ domain-containing protein n=1 Tax=Favolaschia claudopus TaxID=2862362 RepID=A0AAW0BJZ5_9AGAR